MKTAYKGAELAKLAQDVCKDLMNRRNSIETIKEFIEEMKALVKVAQQEVSQTTKVFRDSRQKIYEVRTRRFLCNPS